MSYSIELPHIRKHAEEQSSTSNSQKHQPLQTIKEVCILQITYATKTKEKLNLKTNHGKLTAKSVLKIEDMNYEIRRDKLGYRAYY